MTDVLELAEQLWNGELDIAEHHPFRHLGEVAVVDDRTAFIASFANVSAFATDDGLVLVDTGSSLLAEAAPACAPGGAPLHTAVFTHGHIDHCFGVERYEGGERALGGTSRVVAHEAVPRGRPLPHTAATTRRSTVASSVFGERWPTADYRFPDETYRDRLDLEVGGVRFELHHARGETDDHTWVWAPERRVHR